MSAHSHRQEPHFEFPLRLAADFDEVRLAEDVRIRRIDDASRARILGIEQVVLDENGRIESYVSASSDPLGATLWVPRWTGMTSSTRATMSPQFQPGRMHQTSILP